jgi:predicted nucleic acid-binding protein
VEACVRGELAPLLGTTLMNEYEDILGRAALFQKCLLNASERQELMDVFLANCRWTRIYFAWRPNLSDEGDNHLVELAVAGGARRIVTHNVRDLRSAEMRFPDISAVTPAELLKEMKS